MQDLDILHLPLNGCILIESSAGTGKTYNLIIIYLRLLLNLTSLLDFTYPLTVKEILVVTFTNSVTKELRLRIQNNIKQFRIDCIQGYSNNHIFSQLLLQIQDKNYAINLLSIAEKEMEQASIFTIHAFCQKILTENRIELNILFQTMIVEDEYTLYQQICFDCWRRYFYVLPSNIAMFIQQYWKTPNDLLIDIMPYIYGNNPTFQHNQFITESNYHISNFYNNIINCINNIKIQWIKQQNNIINNIYELEINRKIYNKNNLTRWVEKINQWTKKLTFDHCLPNDLKRFRASILKKYIKSESKISDTFYLSFNIEELYQRYSMFPALIFSIIIREIRQNLNKTKFIRTEITFHDLINLLLQHISKDNNNKLFQKIKKNYPVTMIDEFQDTDFNQYKIFQKLYSYPSKNNSLILIGDPKQAIYSFRGADIFTYRKIRKFLLKKYHLNINWRSSPSMVNAINHLFQISNPFIFQDIHFTPLISAYQNRQYKFLINNKPQESLCFWLHPDDMTTIYNYKIAMAKECVNSIQYLIHQIHCKTVFLENHKYRKVLKKSDIAILVRNHEEASIIRTELLKKNIATVFLSSRHSIFDTVESYELLLLLHAILFPNQNTVCTALTTIFFGLQATFIEKIYNKSESQWSTILQEFTEYYFIWDKYGVFSMIKKIIFRYKIPEILLSTKSGKNHLINILHLGELLDNAANRLYTKYNLLQWLQKKIYQPCNRNKLSTKYMLRYDDDNDLIKISTIHQSKGLEFPITLLPFISNFKHNKKIIFHDRKSFDLYLDFDKSQSKNLKLSDEERLAEDLRLLYVAITRSIYHCAIGVAPIVRKKYKNQSKMTTDFHLSAIGYLIQEKKIGTAELLKKKLIDLNINSNGDIAFRILSNTKKSVNFNQHYKQNQLLSAAKWNSKIIHNHNNTWHISSYSKIKKIQNDITININLQNLITSDLYKKKSQYTILTTHSFPKGKVYGHFFHNLFKNLDFKKPINIQWLRTQMILYNINLNWLETIQQWLYTIINTPLNQKDLTLSKIDFKNKKTEFQFCLNIDTNLVASELNNICKYYDSISKISPVINFETITGMIKGFIDLIFYWNKKYYVLDYKTNWLGENESYYDQKNMKLEIIKHRYDLQYQIYTIALHRFLSYKLTSYNYEKNFGGIYYLFIRGMNGISSDNGIYFDFPIWEFIRKLNNLF